MPFEIWLTVGAMILGGGSLSAAATALATAPRGQLSERARRGGRRAMAALSLTKNSEVTFACLRSLRTTLIILTATTVGIIGVPVLTDLLLQLPESIRLGSAVLIAVAGLVTVQVLFADWIPRRLALMAPVQVACLVAWPAQGLVRLVSPVLWVVHALTSAPMRWLGISTLPPARLSIEDLQQLLESGAADGVLNPVEQHLATEALRLGQRTVRQVMHPRIEIDAADVETPADEIVGAVLMSGFNRLPVYEGNLDKVLGVVQVRDVMLQFYLGRPINLRKLMRPAVFIPESMRLDRLLCLLAEKRTAMAFVVDEFGRTTGLITRNDVLNDLIGELLHQPATDRDITRRDDGRWLVEGKTPIIDLLERMELPARPLPKTVHTVAGLVLEQLGRLPQAGDVTTWEDLSLEVVGLDGKRIQHVLVSTKR